MKLYYSVWETWWKNCLVLKGFNSLILQGKDPSKRKSDFLNGFEGDKHLRMIIILEQTSKGQNVFLHSLQYVRQNWMPFWNVSLTKVKQLGWIQRQIRLWYPENSSECSSGSCGFDKSINFHLRSWNVNSFVSTSISRNEEISEKQARTGQWNKGRSGDWYLYQHMMILRKQFWNYAPVQSSTVLASWREREWPFIPALCPCSLVLQITVCFLVLCLVL